MASLDTRKDAVSVVQFTDTHLFAGNQGRLVGIDTYQTFQQVLTLSRERQMKPDLVLLTGDLAQEETEETYKRVAALVEQIGAPVFFLPGNHDDPEVMAKVMPAASLCISADTSVTAGKWHIVLLNSVIPGKVGGHLKEEQLSYLDNVLAGMPDRHTLVCLHHQPVPIGSAWIDKIGLDNSEEFLSIIKRHSQVRALLWGHVHQEFQQEYDGLLLMATPSTCVQFKPGTSDFALDTRLPGYRWLELGGDGRITTEVARLEGVSVGLDVTAAGY